MPTTSFGLDTALSTLYSTAAAHMILRMTLVLFLIGYLLSVFEWPLYVSRPEWTLSIVRTAGYVGKDIWR